MISILCFFLDHFHYNLLTLQRLYMLCVCVGGSGSAHAQSREFTTVYDRVITPYHYTPKEVNYFNVQHTHIHSHP